MYIEKSVYICEKYINSQNNSIMKDRIANLIKSERLTSQQFAELVDMQSSTISHILAGRNSPSFRIIYGILEAFPMVSPDWLILGKGDMYRKAVSPEINAIENKDRDTLPIEIPDDIDDNLSDPLLNDESFPNVNTDTVETLNSVKIEQKEVATTSESDITCQKPVNEVQTSKIIVMYSDNTFEIYNPK